MNHVLHDHFNQSLINKLNREIESLGKYSYGDNEANLEKMLSLDTFKKLNKRAGNKVTVRYVHSFRKEDGKYFTDRENLGEKYTGSDNGNIIVYKGAFSNGWNHLAKVLVHEYGHAISRFNGNFANNYSKTNSWGLAISFDEVFAFDFQTNFGFTKFITGTNAVDPHLQIHLNKLSAAGYTIIEKP